jgi:hypothetical protein
MPSVIKTATIKAGELVSSSFITRDTVLVSVFADVPCKVRVLGQMEDNDPFLPLSVQEGPPAEVLDLGVGIVLFSVAYMQGVNNMEFIFEDEKSMDVDVNFKMFLRSFPND